jgi:HemY protein
MLWSLVKIILFVALIAVLTLGAGYLAEVGDEIRLAAGGWEFTLTPLAAAVVLVLLIAAVWLMLKLIGLLVAVLKFINGDETAISRYFNRNRERRGFQALADGMMALASGEGRLALSKAAKAERYLRRPELTDILTAQAAEMAGDRARALSVYKRLLADDRTRFVGVQGLLRQKLAEGDTETALKLAEKAFALKPRHDEVQNTLFRLQADTADWTGARATLLQKMKSNTLPRDVHARRDAVLALAEARALLAEGRTEAATQAVFQANRLSPQLVPAATLAAGAQTERGLKRQAAKTLRRAWEATPHPDLAAAFAAIEADETPQARIRRFQGFVKGTESHPESRMLMAELQMAAEDFPAARRALGDLVETHPTARALTIMAAIERGEGAPDRVVRGWLARALSAPRGPQWVCETCNHIHGAWAPVCGNCGAIDTLSWKDPPAAAEPATGAAGMLPLIVGAQADSGAAEGALVATPAYTDAAAAATLAETAAAPSAPAVAEPAAEPRKAAI